MRKTLFGIAALLLLVGFALSAAAADFTLKDSQGKVHHLADHRGKWVLVNFWATWCPPCLEEIPDLVALTETRKDLQVFGVAMEFRDPAQVLQFADGMFVNYPIILGDKNTAEQIGKVIGLPTTFVFDPAGKLAVRHVGRLTRKQIEKLLDGKSKG